MKFRSVNAIMFRKAEWCIEQPLHINGEHCFLKSLVSPSNGKVNKTQHLIRQKYFDKYIYAQLLHVTSATRLFINRPQVVSPNHQEALFCPRV